MSSKHFKQFKKKFGLIKHNKQLVKFWDDIVAATGIDEELVWNMAINTGYQLKLNDQKYNELRQPKTRANYIG